MDIQNRVINYYNNNAFIQSYLKGIDTETGEIILSFNGEGKRITIDNLETIKSIEELNTYFNPVQNTDLNNVTVSPVTTSDNTVTNESLNDMKLLIELKNKEALDNLLKKFAINPSTGLIDINVALSKVTRNTMNEVEKSIKNGYDFSLNAMDYDIEGNFIGTPAMANISEDELISKSFNNVKVYIDAAKMYPDQVNYNDAQVNTFMQTYIRKVKEELHKNDAPVQAPINQAPVAPQVVSEEIPASTSAGFADIFVLTIIVLVYAVIIVNLVIKLK